MKQEIELKAISHLWNEESDNLNVNYMLQFTKVPVHKVYKTCRMPKMNKKDLADLFINSPVLKKLKQVRSAHYFNAASDEDDSYIELMFADKRDSMVVINISHNLRFGVLSTNQKRFDLLDQLSKIADEAYEKNPKVSRQFGLILDNGHGLTLREYDVIGKNEEGYIEEFYNDDFLPLHKKVMDAFENSAKGIVILHGEPGTGKTSYLKYLSGEVEKKLVYVPPDMCHLISNPNFIPFLLNNQNIILVIEDAESILGKREQGQSQSVSNILNITDGILSDILKVQVICTVNSQLLEIDPALLRKGRLIGQYKFGKLQESKTKALVQKTYGEGVKPAQKEMTLAEIFGMKDSEFKIKEKKQAIGFLADAMDDHY